MKKLFLLLIASLSILQAALSQEQSAVFSHYPVAPILVNPAVAGFSENHQILMNIRSQWSGFPESPKTYQLSYNGPIGKTLGVGLGLLSETQGPQTLLRFQLNYGFRYKFQDVKLGMGFSTEFYTVKLASSVLDNKLQDLDDPILNDAVDGNRLFDASLGFWGSFKDKTHIGLSFQNLILAKIGDIESGDPEGSFFRFVVFNLGHEIELDQYNFKLIPSLMVRRIKDVPLQADFNLRGSFINDKLIAGVSYRAGVGGAVGLLLGTNIDVFKIYYSYDVAFQDVQQYNNGTHEVTLAFDFSGGKKKFDRTQGKK